MKVIKLFIVLSLFVIYFSCSIVAEMYGLKASGYVPDTISLDAKYLPSNEEIELEVNKKAMINSESFNKEWVIDRINYWINYYDFNEISYHSLPELYKNLIFDKVYLDIDKSKDQALEKFPESEYFTEKSDISLLSILRKGDIILTRSNYYMNILLGSRYSFHHSMLVISDPTSDTDDCIITSIPLIIPQN